MPIADLPYRIENLRKTGQYAYLANPVVRVPKVVETPAKAKPVRTKLRVLRNVNLCDAPSLWDRLREKSEKYAFYITLRLFATASMVDTYLNSPEVASYARFMSTEAPTLTGDDLVITEETYMGEEAVAIAREEYARMLQSRGTNLSIESLEELVCQMNGIDALVTPKSKRGRKKKAVSEPLPEPEAPPTSISEDEDEAVAPTPVEQEVKTVKPKKRRAKLTLRDQFTLVQATPSRVIDVSKFGDSMQNQSGRILDRVKHEERLATCTTLPNFPLVSDNFAGFKRAIDTLGPRHQHRLAEFKAAMQRVTEFEAVAH